MMDSVFDCIRCSLPLCLETARLLGPLPQPDCTRLCYRGPARFAVAMSARSRVGAMAQ